MQFDVEELSSTKRRIKVEIPAEAVEKALDEAYGELNKTAKVDGFRKGKAPRGVLEKRYGQGVEAEVVKGIVPEYYLKAVEKAGISPVASPNIEEGALKIRKGQPLSFSATVEVRPAFELTGYKGIEVKDEHVEVTDKELDDAIDELREMHSTLEAVLEDRPAARGDFAVIDFTGYVDGEPFDGGRAENYTLELGSGRFIEGFEGQLEGARPGDEREVKVRFPDDYKNEKLKGRDAAFKVKLRELKKKALPALDDELAKDIGLGGTVAEMRGKVREDILAGKKRELASKQKAHLLKELASKHSFELPMTLVDEEYRSMLVRHYQEMLRQGVTPQQVGFDPKEYEKKMRPVAEERVKTGLIISAIAEKEGLTATDEDVDNFLAEMALQTGHNPREIKEYYKKKEGGMEELKEAAGEEKVMGFLLENATRS